MLSTNNKDLFLFRIPFGVYKLPLFVTAVFKQDNVYSVIVKDNNIPNITVAVFTFKDNVTTTWCNEGCSAKINISKDLIDELCEETPYQIPIYYTHIYPNCKTKKIIINNIELTGDIYFKDSLFSKFKDNVNIEAKTIYNPKCSNRIPIQQVNNAIPDRFGKIEIDHGVANDAHITPVCSGNKLTLTSDLHAVDFDKRALTAATGKIGEIGIAGRDGINGAVGVIYQTYDKTKDYSLGIYNNSVLKLRTIYASFFAGNTLIADKGFYYAPDLVNKILLPSDIFPFCGSDIRYLGCSGNKLYNIPTKQKTQLTENLTWVDSNYILTNKRKITCLENNFSITLNEDAHKIQAITPYLWIFYESGKFEIRTLDTIMDYVWAFNFDYKIYATDGNYLACKGGKLYKFRLYNEPKNYSSLINTGKDLLDIKSLNTYTVIVGDGVLFTIDTLKNKAFSIAAPPVKIWKSIYINSANSFYAVCY